MCRRRPGCARRAGNVREPDRHAALLSDQPHTAHARRRGGELASPTFMSSATTQRPVPFKDRARMASRDRLPGASPRVVGRTPRPAGRLHAVARAGRGGRGSAPADTPARTRGRRPSSGATRGRRGAVGGRQSLICSWFLWRRNLRYQRSYPVTTPETRHDPDPPPRPAATPLPPDTLAQSCASPRRARPRSFFAAAAPSAPSPGSAQRFVVTWTVLSAQCRSPALVRVARHEDGDYTTRAIPRGHRSPTPGRYRWRPSCRPLSRAHAPIHVKIQPKGGRLFSQFISRASSMNRRDGSPPGLRAA
jgi:hypothetical protein